MPYWITLALTIGVELAVALSLTKRDDRKVVAAACLLVNFLTHPLATFVAQKSAFPLEVIELAVIAVECLGYRWALGGSWKRAAWLAIACNGVTWALSYAF